MFRLSAACAFCAVLVMAAASAHAQQSVPVYIGLKAGVSLMSADDMENTTNVSPRAPINKKSEDDAVGVMGASIGYNWKAGFGAPIRTDIEYMYRTALNYSPNPTFNNAAIPTKSDGDLNSHSVMASLYWDIGTWHGITPFVGGGLGIAINNTDTKGTIIATGVSKDYSRSETEFAWTAGAGLSYAINKNWSLELAYRYIDLGEAYFGDPNPADAEITAKDVHSHEILAGLRFQF